MLVTDKDSTAAPAVSIVSNDAKGISIKVDSKDGKVATLTFAKGEKPAAALRIEKAGKVIFDGKMPDGIVVEEGGRR